jgi:para-nitrobenzyl esterase
MPVVDGHLIPAPIDQLMKSPLKLDYLLSFTNNDMYAPVMAFIGQRFARETDAFAAYFDLDSPGDKNAAFHSADLRYVFETLDSSWRPYTQRDYEASRQMADYLANFARCGDPNGPGLPLWKRGGGRVLHIAPGKTAMGHVNYLQLTANMLSKGDPKDEV